MHSMHPSYQIPCASNSLQFSYHYWLTISDSPLPILVINGQFITKRKNLFDTIF